MPFQPGQSGNPAGRPRGARNKTTVLFEQLIEGDAETVIRTVIERAKRGDAKALSWLWGIMLPARKGAPVEIDLPPLERPSDAPAVIAAIFAAACAGELSPEEGNSLTRMVEAYVRAQQKLEKLGRTAECAKAAEAVAAEMRLPAEPHVRRERQAPSPRAAMLQADAPMPEGEPSLDSVVAEALRPFFTEASGSLPELRKEILNTTSRLRQGAKNGAEHCIPLLQPRISHEASRREHAGN
jgi:Family of unknown function (DUF5681)